MTSDRPNDPVAPAHDDAHREAGVDLAVRLFAGARVAAGIGSDRVRVPANSTVADVLDVLRQRYGSEFAGVLAHSKVWVNGEPVADDDEVRQNSELAVLPPVSGG